MPDVIENFARLQFDLVEFAMRLVGSPTEADVTTACDEIWARVQGNRPNGAKIRFDDFKLLYEATLDRCKAIVDGPGEE